MYHNDEPMRVAIVECLQENREFTFLDTLQASLTRFVYYWEEFIKSILKVIGGSNDI